MSSSAVDHHVGELNAAASSAAPVTTGSDAPSRGWMRTEYSANARSKCQLCRLKIAKGAWRVQLAVEDRLFPHSDGQFICTTFSDMLIPATQI